MKRKNGFTLIELIGVLVIMAILALIVTPLVMNIIRRARMSADKRSVDAYGRSAELAIASYLLDNGKFPTSIDQLTIEYSGDTVECETTQINPDSSIYLAGCKVKNRNVEGYTYGNDKQPKVYSVGDTVSYNGINYYVLKDSGANELTVNLLKAEPLSYEDVQTYSAGTGADISNRNGYGGMQYGNTNTYSTSYVKTVVDAWKTAKAPLATEARLITKQEIDDNFDFEEYAIDCGGCGVKIQRITENWMYNSNYDYWTISIGNRNSNYIWFMSIDGNWASMDVTNPGFFNIVIRPVIVLDKSVLSTE